jgi:flavorubredoxin
MKPVEMKKDIYWVGSVDWNARDFHGYARSPLGTTYNAFLVKDKKTTLFDTVKQNKAGEFLCTLSHVVKPEDIDYIVVNHLELDHSGTLEEAVEHIKPEKIFTSKMGKRNFDTIFHDKNWPVEEVQTGDELSIGNRKLTFLETKMLHWPDNMATYIPQDKLLISSDAFGQNWATMERFADEVNPATLEKVLTEYYANIVLPFSPVVQKTLKQIEELGLEFDMVAPDHGLMWRGADIDWVIEKYKNFAAQKPSMRAVIIFDTMWHSTQKMAHAIADGLHDKGVSTRIMHVKSDHHSQIMTEIMTAGAVIVGSPTHNNGILPLMAGLLQYVKGLKPKNKIGGAFGSFGWSGESLNILKDWLESMSMDVVDPGVKVKNIPDHSGLRECVEYGHKIGDTLKKHVESFE